MVAVTELSSKEPGRTSKSVRCPPPAMPHQSKLGECIDEFIPGQDRPLDILKGMARLQA